MLTRTLPSPENKSPQPPLSRGSKTENTESPEFIEQQVGERGFYLYEWISPDELRMSVLADYLSIIKYSSIPLAIITLIAGFIGLSLGVVGVIMAVLGVLGFFYTFVLIVLILKMLRKSYLYTRGGNVVITDDHYVSGGYVVKRDDSDAQKSAFRELEKTFREPLLGRSELAEYIKLERQNLMKQMGNIASGGGKIVQNLGRSRDAGGIIMVLMIAGVLYGGMMALVYFLGVFFVSVLARIFAWIAHRVLLLLNNTEHEIQTLFQSITRASIALKSGQKQSVSLLIDAGRGEWTDNLSSKIRDSFEVISEMAGTATDQSVELRRILENSKYADIFNFVKYGNWIQGQILSPIEEILLLLEKNRDTLTHTIQEINSQIAGFPSGGVARSAGVVALDPSLQNPLILQKERFEMQMESIAPMIDMLDGYKLRLTPKK